MTTKSYSKDDLRKLMRQKLESSSTTTTSSKIDSPLASYDSDGNLSCRVCGCRLRENQWTTHLLSKDHKNHIEALKAAALKAKTLTSKKRKDVEHQEFKEAEILSPARPNESSEDSPAKRIKEDVSQRTDKQLLKRDLITKLEEEMNDGEDAMDPTQDEELVKSEDAGSNLPPGFFDASSSHNTQITEEPTISSLPKGFFDDPQADAKARSVTFVDPMDEEYAQFQKLISSETFRSETMVQEDLESFQQEKTVEEIDEQIDKWKKIDRLEQQLEQKMKQSFVKQSKVKHEGYQECDDGSESEEDTDDDKLSCLLDWRRKGGFK